jgi:hypothetical protein
LEIVGGSFSVEWDRSALEAFAEGDQQLIETLDGRDLVAVLDAADHADEGMPS